MQEYTREREREVEALSYPLLRLFEWEFWLEEAGIPTGGGSKETGKGNRLEGYISIGINRCLPGYGPWLLTERSEFVVAGVC